MAEETLFEPNVSAIGRFTAPFPSPSELADPAVEDSRCATLRHQSWGMPRWPHSPEWRGASRRRRARRPRGLSPQPLVDAALQRLPSEHGTSRPHPDLGRRGVSSADACARSSARVSHLVCRPPQLGSYRRNLATTAVSGLRRTARRGLASAAGSSVRRLGSVGQCHSSSGELDHADTRGGQV